MTTYLKTVKEIEFGLIDPEEIKRKAVVKITNADLVTKDNKPCVNGLLDSRMGPYDKYTKCKTCLNDYEICPGHFGYIELETPVMNVHFMNYIKTVLNCVCLRCSSLIIGDDDKIKERFYKKKFDKVLKKQADYIDDNRNSYYSCYNCSGVIKKVFKDRVKIYIKEDDGKRFFSASEILNILKNIRDEDLYYLGFDPEKNKPAWMITTNLIVLPPCTRPSVSFGNVRSEDDLTFKLIEIIRANNSLAIKKREYAAKRNLTPEEQEKADIILERHVSYTEYHVYTYFDNNLSSMPTFCHKSKRPLKTLKERFIGKEGIVRQNLIGKRVNYSSRSVVSPEPLIDIDQLGVPMKICQKMTFPEVVNQFNIEKLTQMILNGPDIYPGARFIEKKNGNKRDLKFVNRETIKLEYGDIVERHLCEDDIVLFNRQPSLHKFSMMAHRVKPLEGNSFRLNPNVASPYNADFDGDEMNMHVCRSVYAETELRMIASVKNNIVSPQSNKPIIGFIMDTVVGSYKLTNKDKLLNKNEAYAIISSIKDTNIEVPSPVSCDRYGRPLWSGRELMSLIVPQMNYFRSGDEESIIIKNGRLQSGVFDKKIVGAASGGLIHMITNDLGNESTKKFMGDGQRLINTWLKHEGFSVGFSDILVSEKQQKNIDNILKSAESATDRYIEEHIIKNKKISKEEFENKIFALLNKARDEAGNVSMNGLDNTNSLYSMVKSGSKGNFINISQITACVGQQNVQYMAKSGRTPFLYQQRTLPHFQKFDVSAQARGFVRNSYLNGLLPEEFFFHTQSGREGLIDTAVKTAETGYIQRKLMKSMEDLRVVYDMSVRNEFGNIIQFCYGSDAFDASHIEKQNFELITVSNQEYIDEYVWEDLSQFSDSVVKYLKEEELFLANKRKHYRKLEFYKDDTYAPVNFSRIILNSKNEEGIDRSENLSIEYYIQRFEELNESMYYLADKETILKKITNISMDLFRTLMKSKLSSKQLLIKQEISKGEFDWIMDLVYDKFYQAVIQPGECVGAVAAQSISEPTTQLSVDYDTMVPVKVRGELRVVKIGEFIDKTMLYNQDKIIELDITEEGNSSVINFENDVFQVPSVDEDGNIEWKRLTQISRHPPNGDMVEVETEQGRKVLSTLSHTFLTVETDKIKSIRGDELQIGDTLPIVNKKMEKESVSLMNERVDNILLGQYDNMDRDQLDMILEYATRTGNMELLDSLETLLA